MHQPEETGAERPDAPVRGRIRGRRLRRVCHGLGLLRREGLSDRDERLRDLAAYLAVAPASAVFTGLTAAELMGWTLPKMPHPVPVFLAVDLADRRPRRHGLVCHRVKRVRRRSTRHGLPVDEPEEVLLALGRVVGRLDLLIVLESALHLGDLDPDRLAALLDSGRPGVAHLRWASERATAKAESAGESVLYEFHRSIDVPFEPQVELFDDRGAGLGRVDLLVTGTSLVHEYDGQHHTRKDQQRTDLRRARGLSGAAYERRGYTLDDLLNHDLVVLHEIDRALDRPHRVGRLAEWRALVENSLYADTGRARILHRWRRAGGAGGVPWARAG